MTTTRTPYAAVHDHTGIVRATHLEISQAVIVHEGVQFGMFAGVPRITLAAATGFGAVTAVGLDLSRADLLHIADVAAKLAARMGEGA